MRLTKIEATMDIIRSRVNACSAGKAETDDIDIRLFDELVPFINKMPTETMTKKIEVSGKTFKIKYSRK